MGGKSVQEAVEVFELLGWECKLGGILDFGSKADFLIWLDGLGVNAGQL